MRTTPRLERSLAAPLATKCFPSFLKQRLGVGAIFLAGQMTVFVPAAVAMPLCLAIGGSSCETIVASEFRETSGPTGSIGASGPKVAKAKPAQKPAPKATKMARKQATADDDQSNGSVTAATALAPLDSLKAVVERAMDIHPQIGAARARAKEAHAGIAGAKSALFPQLDTKLAGGQGVIGTAAGQVSMDQFGPKAATGSSRTEMGVTLRYKLVDFGATDAAIESAEARNVASTIVLKDVIEDISIQVSLAYLRVLETRETLAISEENVAALTRLKELVELNESNGNSTMADVKRISARLLDAQTILADAQSDASSAGDRFQRLVQVEPGKLKQAPSLNTQMPKQVQDALGLMPSKHLKYLAGEETLKSLERDADSQFASTFPKISLETDATTKSYRSRTARDDLDFKTMVAFSYKLVDGGNGDAGRRQALARVEQQYLQNRYMLDEAMADVRQYYRSIAGARNKTEALQNGVTTSSKARELYDEQFAGGKRTLFELLDIQSAYYQARRSQITNRYEEHRSVFNVLRSLGKLYETVTGTQPDTTKNTKSSVHWSTTAAADVVECCGPIPR